jgi:hypothetical protein
MDFFALTRFRPAKTVQRTGLEVSQVMHGYRHCLGSS